MSDISLPPLPPFGASPSDAGSSGSSSSSDNDNDNGDDCDDDDDDGDDLEEDGEVSSAAEGSWEYGQEQVWACCKKKAEIKLLHAHVCTGENIFYRLVCVPVVDRLGEL